MISDQIRQDHSSYQPNKEADRSKIQRDIDTFLENGGQIDRLPDAVCSYDWANNKKVHWWSGTRSLEDVTKRQKAGKRRLGMNAG